MKKTEAYKMKDAYRNRGGLAEESTSPPKGTKLKRDYQVYRVPFEWSRAGTFKIEFSITPERCWSQGSVYVDPWALHDVEAPLVKHFGSDYEYEKTEISKSQLADILETWSRMRDNALGALCADDLFLALENPHRGDFEASQWELREDILTMLSNLLDGLSELQKKSEKLWILGL